MKPGDVLELEIRREGLLRKTARLRDIRVACDTAAKAAAKHRRLAHVECNGLPKAWNPARREFDVGLDASDVARIDAQMQDCRDRALAALKSILTPGLEYDFQNDAVYCMVRVRDKANRRAFSL
jgi:hypothetical protein